MIRSQKNKGQSMVELALSLTVLFIMTLGVIDFARIFSTYQRMTSVGREAGRIYVKQNYDTTATTAILRDGPQGVKIKVYDAIANSMQPDKLTEQGSVIISVLRRVDGTLLMGTNDTLVQRQTAEADDQLELVHRFIFDASPATGSIHSKINYVMDKSKIIVDGTISGVPDAVPNSVIRFDTVRLGEELVVVEMYYENKMMTGIDKLFPALTISKLYDQTIF